MAPTIWRQQYESSPENSLMLVFGVFVSRHSGPWSRPSIGLPPSQKPNRVRWNQAPPDRPEQRSAAQGHLTGGPLASTRDGH